MTSELKQAAERQAKREHRSLSSLISFVLARYLGEAGAGEDAGPPEAEGLPRGAEVSLDRQ